MTTLRATHRPARTLAVLVAMLGWLLGLSLAFAPSALAHAELEATTPGNGEHLASAPTQMTLKFSENVNLIHDGIQVLAADGSRADHGSPKSSSGTVRVSLRAGLKDGIYTVNWRVVSADSHPVYGAFVFSVGNATATALTGPVTRSGGDRSVTDALWVMRLGGYAGIALLAGGVFFCLVCWPRGRADGRARRIVRVGLVTSVVAAVGSLLVQGPNSAGGSLGKVLDPGLLAQTLGTDYGVAMVARLVLLGAVAVALRLVFRPEPADGAGPSDPWWRTGVLVALALGLGATFSWSGHAHVGDQAPLAVVSDIAHLGAMSVWVGGLVLLTACVLPASRAVVGEAARVLPRFSRAALSAVAVLVGTGFYQAWREIRSVSALAGSSYGTLLIFKLAIFGVLMALAAMSRSAVQRRYVVPVTTASAAQGAAATTRADRAARKALREQQERERAALGALRQSVRLEALVVIGVLGLTSALVATPPGQVASGFEAAPITSTPTVPGPVEVRIPLGPGETASAVDVRLTPGRAGPNQMSLTLRDGHGVNQDVRGLTATLSRAANRLAPIPVTLKHLARGQWTASSVLVPSSGSWTVTLKVRTSEFDETTVTGTLRVN